MFPYIQQKNLTAGMCHRPLGEGITKAISSTTTVKAKSCNTIPSIQVALKDKLGKSDTIYHIECHQCDQVYMRETEINIKRRLETSPVREHL